MDYDYEDVIEGTNTCPLRFYEGDRIMANYVITCCSTVDMNLDWLAKRDLQAANFSFHLGNEEYKDDFGQSIDQKEIYRRMLAGEDAKTSQVSTDEYVKLFTKNVKEGKDVIHITLSSGISGTYNSASTAANMVMEEYPDRKIYVIDSTCASSGYGLLVDYACDLRDEGKSIEDVHELVEKNKKNLQHWFCTTDLTFFIKGGRVSKAAGIAGKVLNICPLLNVNVEGKLIAREKVRTKKKVLARLVEKMEERAEGGLDYTGKVFISNSDCLEDAKAVADMIEQKFTKMKGRVEINPIGATIGCHTGPGTVALFFWGDEREV